MAMNENLLPNISSFVIRFVMDSSVDTAQNSPSYRGVIRHIQTDEEVNFIHWEDVEKFIRRFVPLDSQETGVA